MTLQKLVNLSKHIFLINQKTFFLLLFESLFINKNINIIFILVKNFDFYKPFFEDYLKLVLYNLQFVNSNNLV